MAAVETVRFEFSYKDIATGNYTGFALVVAEDVAMGIQVGLEDVPSITEVTVHQVVELREEVNSPLRKKGN
jgi:hypothetical protein